MPSLDDLLDRAPCGFLSFSDAGVVVLANETILRMLGHQAREVVGQHVERLMTVGSRIFYQTHWFPLLRLHGHAEEIFLTLRARDGEVVGVLVNAVRHERDGEAAYDCVVMQVRERQKYEDELLRARRAAEDAAVALRQQARDLQDANDQLESQAVELEMQQQQLHEQAAVLESASEELRVINEDLIERTEEAEHLREVAEAANQAKSAFLAVMSHELRTPLNAIAGYVQLLEMGIHGPVTPAQLEALDRVGRSQRHLLRLINDVLDLARIEAGRVEYAIEAVSVSETVAGVTPMIEPQLQKANLRFDARVAPGLVALADREKLQQILLNLLGNAVKFTPRGGSVAVEAVRAPDAAERMLIRVVDTGIGIPPEKVAAVFERFVQVDDGRRQGVQGSGLGLAISRELARGMRGDLTAESRMGEGSTFTLELPLAQPAAGDA